MFDRWIMVDWSGGNDTGPRPRRDAIWLCEGRNGITSQPEYLRNRSLAQEKLRQLSEEALIHGDRLALGFDFPFGYPRGFCEAVTGSTDPFLLWHWFFERVEDTPKMNNRFDLAGSLNKKLGDGLGPFWGNGLKRDIDGLPRNRRAYRNPFPERRVVETLAKGSFTCWQLAGAGAVGSQVIMGLPVLQGLRRNFPGQIAVWPFQKLDRPIVFLEIWPSLRLGAEPRGVIRDAWQVREVAREWSQRDTLGAEFSVESAEEGWILGVPQERKAA